MELNLDWRREASPRHPGVAYEIRPLRVWAFQELMALWDDGGAPPAGEEGTRALSPAAGLRWMPVAERIFAEHVRGLEGVTVVEGGQRRPATAEDLCREAGLLELAGEILQRLVAVSELGPGDEKN